MKPLSRLFPKAPLPALFLLATASARLLFAAETPLPGARDLGLADAVQVALLRNPRIEAADSGRTLAAARTNEARSGWFPRLELSGTFARSNNPVFVFGSLLEQERFTTENFGLQNLNDPSAINNFRTAATLQVPLFDQFQTDTRVHQARLGQEQADLQRELTEQRLRFQVVRTYYGILLAEANRSATEEAVKAAEADVGRIRDLFDAGIVVQSDLLAAQVQLSEFRQGQIEAAGGVTVAYAALNTVLGLPIVTAHRVTGQLVEKEFTLPEQADLVRQALAQRPEYADAKTSVRSAQEEARRASGQYLPRLDAFATYAGSGKDLSIDSTDYTVGARLSFNLFDRARGARHDQARATVSLATAGRAQVASQIELEVVQAYQHFISARERLQVASGTVAQAEEAHRIVRDRYQAGLTTITEVLRTQTALLRARLGQLGARYDHYVGYGQVLLAAGALRDVNDFEP